MRIKNNLKIAEVHLSYFKQGDDMNDHLENQDTIFEALNEFSARMKLVSEHLNQIAEFIDKNPSKQWYIEADTHFISINGPENFIDELIRMELASESMFEKEDQI